MQPLLRLVLVPAFAALVVAGGACGRSDLFSERHRNGMGGDGSIDIDGGGGFGGSVGGGRDGGPDAPGVGGSTAGRGGTGGSVGGRGGSTAGRGGAAGSTAG